MWLIHSIMPISLCCGKKQAKTFHGQSKRCKLPNNHLDDVGTSVLEIHGKRNLRDCDPPDEKRCETNGNRYALCAPPGMGAMELRTCVHDWTHLLVKRKSVGNSDGEGHLAADELPEIFCTWVCMRVSP
jgi:hypothetical protein